MGKNRMSKSEADRFARTYRLAASRLYLHLCNGKAEKSGAEAQIKKAHDALCEAFKTIETKNGVV